MILGIDFDNTLACYDGIFHAEAVRRGLLDATTLTDKKSVRQALIEKGLKDEFVKLQGYAYGPGIMQAPVYQGVFASLQSLQQHDVQFRIISHKTPFPYLGEAYDLRAFARTWLEANGFYENNLIDRDDVFFESDVPSKVRRILKQNCTHFIDDLPEILLHPLFPSQIQTLFFDPQNTAQGSQQTKALPLATFLTWESMGKSLIHDALQK